MICAIELPKSSLSERGIMTATCYGEEKQKTQSSSKTVTHGVKIKPPIILTEPRQDEEQEALFLIVLVLSLVVAQQDVVHGEPGVGAAVVVAQPLGLDAEEDPDPAAEDL